jgi:hypothetical protein
MWFTFTKVFLHWDDTDGIAAKNNQGKQEHIDCPPGCSSGSLLHKNF